eukprot:jgi/Botrbrau1/16006/Bobra.0353s0004.2
MVKIVDGEIIREDDPRYKTIGLQSKESVQAGNSQQQAANFADTVLYGPTRNGPRQGGANVFNFSLAPVALAPDPPGQSLFGLPGLDIFGAHLQSTHLLLLVAATLFLGWKGFLMGSAIWVAYKLSSGPDVPDPQGCASRGQPSCKLPGAVHAASWCTGISAGELVWAARQ